MSAFQFATGANESGTCSSHSDYASLSSKTYQEKIMGKLTVCCCYCDAAGFLFGCLHEWREDQQSCKRCAAIFTTASYLERCSAA